jgi:hypothetical protein
MPGRQPFLNPAGKKSRPFFFFLHNFFLIKALYIIGGLDANENPI